MVIRYPVRGDIKAFCGPTQLEYKQTDYEKSNKK